MKWWRVILAILLFVEEGIKEAPRVVNQDAPETD